MTPRRGSGHYDHKKKKVFALSFNRRGNKKGKAGKKKELPKVMHRCHENVLEKRFPAAQKKGTRGEEVSACSLGNRQTNDIV